MKCVCGGNLVKFGILYGTVGYQCDKCHRPVLTAENSKTPMKLEELLLKLEEQEKLRDSKRPVSS